MGSELRFDDKVVIVTGAGGGLGRSHALLFGSRGAKVVVNDLGGGAFGEGQGAAPADQVVTMIEEGGGEAVANYDSVEDGDKIIQTALDTYGRVDVVVNNAGILRDSSFHKMDEKDWDLIYRVHVYGSYKVTAAAWSHMRNQGYGRIVMTASAAGIYGNFGQANYAMAKLGLVGLANTLAIEGRKKGVHVNTIAPIAASRLTETVMPKEVLEPLKPELVSPLVAWLSHEDCDESGGLFEVGGGFFAKLRWERSTGKTFRVGREVKIEDVQKSFGAITSFETTEHPADITSSMGPIMSNVQKGKSKGGNEFIDVDEALGFEFEEMKSSYDERDLAIYALGVGAAKDPNDDKDLKLVYELHGGGFQALPTFGVIPAVNCVLELATQGKQAPGLNYGLDRLLHGEQYTELKRPLPPNAKLTHKATIKDIFDKGKGATVITAIESRDEDGDVLVYNEITSFVRGAGGWGGDSGPPADINTPPERAPDKVIEEKIPENQALLYRLSGDWNPLHADPSFAKAIGYDKPILHGLCTFGYAGRHVVQAFAPDGNPGYFKSIKTRMAKPVFPGETIVTEMWKESETRIVFRTTIKDRDIVCLSHAAVELYEEIPVKAEKKKAAAPGAAAPTEPIAADIFTAIGGYLADNAALSAKIKTVYQFKLTGPDSVWTVDVKSDTPTVAEGEGQKPDCTFELSDANFMKMVKGEADAQKLYFGGELKISGDVMASQKATFLSEIEPERVIAAMKARGGGGGGDAAVEAEAEPVGPLSADVFLGIKAYVADNANLVGEIGTVFQFKLTEPDAAYYIDLKTAPGSAEPGVFEGADVTLELSEDNFIAMGKGDKDPQKMYFSGELKVSGNIMASQKLSFLQDIDPAWAAEKIAELKASGAGKAAPVAAAPAKRKEAAGPKVLEALAARLSDKGGLSDEVQAVVVLRVSSPAMAFTVDLKQEPGTVAEGAVDDAAATLHISDDDLRDLVSGATSAQALYQHGQLRVDGDVKVAHRLGFLDNLL